MTKIRKERIAKRKALIEWSKQIRDRDGKCCYCGTTEHLNAHHVYPKEAKDNVLKLDILNGITLCSRHHKYSYEFSPHKNPLIFIPWFIKKYPERYHYLISKV